MRWGSYHFFYFLLISSFLSFPFLRRSCQLHSRRQPLIQPLITGIPTRYCTHSGLHYLIYTIVCSSLFVFVCTCAAEIWLLPSWRIWPRTGALPGLVARTPAHTGRVSVSSLH